jgi:hypothetical protein
VNKFDSTTLQNAIVPFECNIKPSSQYYFRNSYVMLDLVA